MNTSRKTIYTLSESMFRFWYSFVPENAALFQSGMADRLWEKVEPQIPSLLGGVFEEVCKQWLWRENAAGRRLFSFARFGRWWGNDPLRKQEAEIDILVISDDGSALFAGCKWNNEKVDAGVLHTLIRRGDLFHYREKHYYLFSKSGFKKECLELASHTRAVLVDFKSLSGPS